MHCSRRHRPRAHLGPQLRLATRLQGGRLADPLKPYTLKPRHGAQAATLRCVMASATYCSARARRAQRSGGHCPHRTLTGAQHTTANHLTPQYGMSVVVSGLRDCIQPFDSRERSSILFTVGNGNARQREPNFSSARPAPPPIIQPIAAQAPRSARRASPLFQLP